MVGGSNHDFGLKLKPRFVAFGKSVRVASHIHGGRQSTTRISASGAELHTTQANAHTRGGGEAWAAQGRVTRPCLG
jgi:hypothetical protein